MKSTKTWDAFFATLWACVILLSLAALNEYSDLGEVNNRLIRFPSLSQILRLGKTSEVLSEEAQKRLASQKLLLADSLGGENKTNNNLPNTDTLEINFITNPIQADGNYGLDNFFEALYAGESVRIAHFGDSQIEGDRITTFLRENFQRYFEGVGFGYLPLFDPAAHTWCSRKHSSNWIRYNIFSQKSGTPFYSLSGNTYRYQPIIPEKDWPKFIESGEKLTAWVSFDLVPNITYRKVNLLWGRSPVPLVLKIYTHDTMPTIDTLPPSLDFTITPLPITPNSEHIKIIFESIGIAPDIYGFSFDGERGVQIDNYAIRGHSGEGLSLISSDYLAKQIRMTGTKLLIFQYGGNAVPMTQNQDFTFFEDNLYQMLSRFRRLVPDVNLLVIGLADQAQKTEEGWISYHTVEKIRNAQIKAAQRVGVPFWDLYAVMGGKNAMVTWVNSSPPLAAKDYAHFTYHGQKLVGRLLFNALMKEYGLWLERQSKQQAAKQPFIDSKQH